MKRSALLVAVAGLFGLTSLASAQAPSARGNDRNGHEFRASQVIGSKVSLQGIVAAGTVEDVVIGEDGQVDYLVVNQDNKLVAIPWEAANFNVQQKTATVNITQETFKTVPTFSATEYNQLYVPEFRTRVYKAYNLTPREVRKINRQNR